MNQQQQKMAAAWLSAPERGFKHRPHPGGIAVRVPDFNPRTGEWSHRWVNCNDFDEVRRAIGYGAPTEGEA